MTKSKKIASVSLILKFFRLPLDFVLLTFHYLKGTSWLIVYQFKRRIGLNPRKRWIFGCFTCSLGDSDTDYTCLPGRKYGAATVFRALCSDCLRNASTGETYCAKKMKYKYKHWRPSWKRVIALGVLLFVSWQGIGYGLFMTFRPERVLQDHAEEAGLLALVDTWYAEGRYAEAAKRGKIGIQLFPENVTLKFMTALCLIELEQHGEAQSLLADVVHLDSRHWNAHLELAKLAMLRVDPQKALEHAVLVCKVDPGNQEAHLISAACYYLRDDPNSALASVEAATAQPLSDPELMQQAALVYQRLNDLDAAERLYTQSLDKDPNSVVAGVGLADICMSRGQWEIAKHRLDALIALDAGNPKVVEGLVRLHIGQGKMQDALEAYQKLLQQDPTNSSIRFAYATMLVQTGNTDEAARLLKGLVADYPDHKEAVILLARIYSKFGLHSLAIEHLERLSNKHPENVGARQLLAESYLATKNFSQAIIAIQSLLKAKPDELHVRMMLVDALSDSGDVASAITAASETAERFPASSIPLMKIGLLHRESGNVELAVGYYREALARAPNDPVAANNLALFLSETGNATDLDEAVTIAADLVRRYPGNAVVSDSVGWIFHKKGDYKTALEYFENAIQLNPGLPDPHYHSGKSLVELNKIELAINAFRKSLQLSTSFEGADDARTILEHLPGVSK